MASIAFCLKHDSSLCEHFLKVVCGIRAPQRIALHGIEIEQHPWGDLVLTQHNQIYVIEGKIKAKLEAKQNPEKRTFWNDGYGAAMLRNFGEGDQLHYIVLGYPEKLKMPKNKRIECRQVYWHELEERYPAKVGGGLAADLADCLSELEVDAFYLREAKRMKVTHPKEAACAFEIIIATLKELGLKKQNAKIAGYHTKNAREFGAELWASPSARKDRSPLPNLKDIVKPKNHEAIAWFELILTSKASGAARFGFIAATGPRENKFAHDSISR